MDNIFNKNKSEEPDVPVVTVEENQNPTSPQTEEQDSVKPSKIPQKEVVVLKAEHDPTGKFADVNIIDLVKISQKYDDGKTKTTVFEDLDFSIKDVIKEGQFTSIMGKSGCGKSTILRYISGLQTPSSGDVYIYGKKRTDDDRIPMVFQQYTSYEWMSVLENVALPLILKHTPKKEAHEQAMKMIEIVGLLGHEHKYAKYPTLSGGQLQRVAIARNLISNSQILLMDEPFGALDFKTRGDMQIFLRSIFESAQIDPTVIFVTHDITEAVFLSTDIVILDSNPGRIKHHIVVDLPEKRDISLQDDPRFIDQVRTVRSLMRKL